jgi:hypothetical protein
MPEQLDQPVYARIPETFVVTEPVVGPLERPRVDAAIMDASPHRPFHQAGPLEGLDVLRRRSQRHPVGCGELADRLLPLGEPGEHGSAGVIAEGTEDEVEIAGMLNHMVEYGPEHDDCQPFG